MYVLQIKEEDRGWSYMFQVLEDAREQLGLEDYSLSQTSLESVFLRFASSQHDDEHERLGVSVRPKVSSAPPVASTRFT